MPDCLARKFKGQVVKLHQAMAEERGATATEYGILMAFVVIVAMAGVSLFGLALAGWYDELTTHLKLVLGIP